MTSTFLTSNAPSGRTFPAPRAVLFDLDDTLWPIGPVIAQAEVVLHDWLKENTPEVARKFSIETLREHRMALLEQEPSLRLDLAALRRAGLEHAFEQVGADPAHIDSAMRHYMVARNAVTLYEDVLPGLMRLQDKVLVGSISNGNANLEVIGLAHHFKVSLAAATFGGTGRRARRSGLCRRRLAARCSGGPKGGFAGSVDEPPGQRRAPGTGRASGCDLLEFCRAFGVAGTGAARLMHASSLPACIIKSVVPDMYHQR
jgi:phosphoglycolate phosphatase-like HAD superfamily hydrolase